MTARRPVLIFLVVLFMVIPALSGYGDVAPDATGASRPADAEGVCALIMDFIRATFTTRPAIGSSVEDDGDDVFSKNPYVYVIAFWSEIVKAPKEMGFLERIMSFLEAVKVKR